MSQADAQREVKGRNQKSHGVGPDTGRKAVGARRRRYLGGARWPTWVSRPVTVGAILGWCLMPSAHAWAAPGDLDASFGAGGLLTTDVGPGPSAAQGVARQSDGKLVVVGGSRGRGGEFAIARYHADGSLDTTFANDGRQTTSFEGFGGASALAVAIQPDGRIVAAGMDTNAGGDFAFVRYEPNGEVDASFAEDGRRTVDFGAFGGARATDVVIQSDGKILAVGNDSGNAAGGFALIRLNPDGSLDTSFSGDGTQTTTLPGGGPGEGATAVTLQADGKAVVVGEIGGDFAIARYGPNGALDATFGGDGYEITDLGDSSGAPAAVVIQPDGKIIAAGSNGDVFSANADIALVRYETDGALDASFGIDGVSTTDVAGGHDFASAVAIDGDGRIVVTGTAASLAATHDDFLFARYDAQGHLDPTFGSGGTATVSFAFQDEGLDGMLAEDGKVVAVGRAEFNGDFAVARLTADGENDTSFSGDGKLTTEFSGADAVADVAIDGEGRIIAVGTGQGDFTVARYSPAGMPDPTFAGDGVAVTDANGFGNGSAAAAVAVQEDGKVVVVGSGAGLTIARYNADGSLDADFADEGLGNTHLGSFTRALGVALQPDGKIVVVGTTSFGGGSDFAVARYDADGSLDLSFSDDGVTTTDLSGGSFVEEATDVRVQPDGKIVVVGVSGPGFGLARYKVDGELDATFAEGGTEVTAFGGALDGASALALLPDGKIVVVGGNGNGNFALARYSSTGDLDPAFGDDGIQSTDFGGGSSLTERAEDVALQPDGKIVVVGSTGDGSGSGDFAVARYQADGQLDAAFAEGGTLTTDFAGRVDRGAAVALDIDGDILVAGMATNESEDLAFAKYLAGAGAPDLVPPETTITAGPTGTISDPTPSFSFSSSEADSSFECRVDSAAFASCTSPHTVTAVVEGSHTFAVRAIDPSGNVDPSPATRSFTLDIPDRPSEDPPADARGRDTTTADPTPSTTPSGALTPRLGHVRVDRKVIHPRGRVRQRRAVLRFRVSSEARVRITVSRRKGGVRRGKRCVERTRTRRKGRHCDLLVARLARQVDEGVNRIRLSARMGGKRLAPGRYSVVIVARNDGGASKPKRLVLLVKR